MEKRTTYLLLILLIVWVCFCIVACDNPTSPGLTVTVNLNLPQPAPGRYWFIGFDENCDGDYTWLQTGHFEQEDEDYIFEFDDVPPGTYFLIATVFAVSGGSGPPVAGDYTGYYMREGQERGDVVAPNAVVPESGSVTFNVTLWVMTAPM
jgi:hypothetical protein